MSWLFFLYLLFFLFHSPSRSSSFSPSPPLSPPPPLCHPDESSALLQFKSSFSIVNHVPDFPYCFTEGITLVYDTGISYNTKTSLWNNTMDCCSWSGVTCDKVTGHVISIDLGCSGLHGILHWNSSLFLLGHIQSLILSHNDFKGSSISPQFGKFVSLTHLDLSHSNFFGQVPQEISYLSKLVSLNLSGNKYLRLETSFLERISRNLTDLEGLIMYKVNMSSVVLTSLLNLSSSLTFLCLNGNRLNGKFPTNLFHLPNLQGLDLGYNRDLLGALPKYNWSSPLQNLSLSHTGFLVDLPHLTRSLKLLNILYLSHCNFISTYPSLVGNFSTIVSLDLSHNNFHGQIPWSSLNLEQLDSLTLSGNNFHGQLPDFCSNTTQISLACNSSEEQLVGHVPLNLISLWLDDNLLNGTIPSWLYSLPNISFLFLDRNQFTGYLDEFKHNYLLYLGLASNKLSGHIPKSIFQQVHLISLDLSSNNLSGTVVFEQFLKLNHLNELDLSFNNFSLSSNDFMINSSWPHRLHRLTLSSCNLREFPSFLKAVESLGELDLSQNQIEGKIPRWLSNIWKDSLYSLNLSHNFITNIEEIPWQNIGNLDLRSNLLQGHLPLLPPYTTVLFISNNQLTGEIPSQVCSLSYLFILDLSNNSFSGKLPPCIGNLSSLSVLNLRKNRFHGTIPATFTKGNNLRNLNLNGNQLEGSLPISLLACKSLEVLDLGNNKISDAFPYWLESLPMLQVLILRTNKFHGSIAAYPNVRLPFRKLRIMDLSQNEFNGPLSTEYFDKLMAMMHVNRDRLKYMGDRYYHDSITVVMKGIDIELVRILNIFTTVDFSQNNFDGEIPKSIGMLKALKGLNLSYNKLTGLIPPSLGNLSELEWLDLSSNKLSGEIPQQLADLTQLENLNLSQNRLAGQIPRGNQFNTFNNDSYSGNLGLCGFPVSKSCSKEDEAEQESDEEDNRIEFEWKIVMMGYGCGLVIGISIGYIVLSGRKFDYWIAKRVGGKLQHGERPRRLMENAHFRGRRRN